MMFKKNILLFVVFLIFQLPNLLIGQREMNERYLLEIKENNKIIQAARNKITNLISVVPYIDPNDKDASVFEAYEPIANELLESYNYYPDLWFQFLYMRRALLNTDQISRAKVYLRKRLTEDVPFYHQLIYYYQLTSKIPDLEKNIEPNLLDTVRYFVNIEKRIPKKYREQLANMATLANLGNQSHEDSLLCLIRDTYKEIEDRHGLDSDNQIRFTLYHNILPSTAGILRSRRSTLNLLYLLEDPKIDPPVDEFSSTVYSKAFFELYIKRRIHDTKLPSSIVESYQNDKILTIKASQWKEVLSDDDLWRPITSY